jgi:predicted O-methyltransferase YrrM
MTKRFNSFFVRKWLHRVPFLPVSGRTLLAPKVQAEPASRPFDDIGIEHLPILATAPVWMSSAERLLLYSLAYSLRPARYLEIGSLYGGSAMIVCAALDALDVPSRMILVDPAPRITASTWASLAHRAMLVTGASPAALAMAEAAAGAKFDFVLVDGDHRYHAVVEDLVGVLKCCCDGAYILCHDCFYHEVGTAIDDFVRVHAGRVVDFGPLTREITFDPDSQASTLPWGGFRMLQVRY